MASPGCGLKALSLEIGQELADEWMSSSLKLQPNLDGKASFDRLLRRIGFFYRSIEVSHADDTGNGRAEVSCFLDSATLCKWEHPLNQAEQN